MSGRGERYGTFWDPLIHYWHLLFSIDWVGNKDLAAQDYRKSQFLIHTLNSGRILWALVSQADLHPGFGRITTLRQSKTTSTWKICRPTYHSGVSHGLPFHLCLQFPTCSEKAMLPNHFPALWGKGKEVTQEPFWHHQGAIHVTSSWQVDAVTPSACIRAIHLPTRWPFPHDWCKNPRRQPFLDRKPRMISFCKVFQSAANQTHAEHSAFYFFIQK